MTILTSPLLSSKPICNLDTYQYTVQSAAMHLVAVTINEIPSSGITVVIERNGSPVASTSVPAAAQSVINLSDTLNCAVNDTISVVVSSSVPSDQVQQSFKGLIRIEVGQSN
jgi:hypothetical protein